MERTRQRMDECMGYIVLLIVGLFIPRLWLTNCVVKENMTRYDKGFRRADAAITLVCVAFLFATLGAVGARGREHAKRILCASRLQKWGEAIIMHSADNDDMVMSITRRWGGVPMTCYMSTVQNYPGDSTDAVEAEWNAYSINPYVPVIDADYVDNGVVTDFVTCPTVDNRLVQDWIKELNWPWSDFIEIAYCYWGRADQLSPENYNYSQNAKDVLTLDRLSAERLLMSDILWLTGYGFNMAYRYNYGQNGWSWNSLLDIPGHNDFSPYPKATGRNRLFGDGRVVWKTIPAESNLPTHEDIFFQQNDGMWNGPDSGWVGDQWDCSYF